MKTKGKPMPITSFLEDDFDINAYRKMLKRQEVNNRHRVILFLVKFAMPIVALALALLLYGLIDNFIAQRQFQRYSSFANSKWQN